MKYKSKHQRLEQYKTDTFWYTMKAGGTEFLINLDSLWSWILVRLSLKPSKTFKTESGLLVKQYRNGRLKATRISQK